MDPTTPSPEVASESPVVSPTSDQIVLCETDRSRLQTFVHMGYESARARTRAQVLLKIGEGWSLAEVCRAFDVCRNTVVNVRARYAEGGVDAVVRHKRQVRYRQALSGSQQAHFIAIACSPVPRPLDAAPAGGQSRRVGLRRADLPRNHPSAFEKTNSSPGGIGSGVSRRR